MAEHNQIVQQPSTSRDPNISSPLDDPLLRGSPVFPSGPHHVVFRRWCGDQDLTSATISTLISEGFTSKRLLALAEPDDVQGMDIKPRAQHRAVLKAISLASANDSDFNQPKDTNPAPQNTDSGSGTLLDSI